MSDIITADRRKDLHTAITELILDLKGNGTVSSVQTMTGVHRNMLTAIFEVYDAQMRGDEVRTKSKSNPRIKNLYWGTNSLITVADRLGIRVSELIRAAEDVQDGLPPWFERRISRDVAPRSTAELGHIFFEVLGYLTYTDPFPSEEPKKKVRQYHKKVISENLNALHITEKFSERDVAMLTVFTEMLFDPEYLTLQDFVNAYRKGEISSKGAFFVLKTAVDEVEVGIQGCGMEDLTERLRARKNKLVEAINKAFRLFIGGRK